MNKNLRQIKISVYIMLTSAQCDTIYGFEKSTLVWNQSYKYFIYDKNMLK